MSRNRSWAETGSEPEQEVYRSRRCTGAGAGKEQERSKSIM
jgi:hypothetical protein